MKMLVSIGLSTFFHALGVGGVIFFASSSLKTSLVQTGDGSVEMEFVVKENQSQARRTKLCKNSQIYSSSKVEKIDLNSGQTINSSSRQAFAVPVGQARTIKIPFSHSLGIDMSFIPMPSDSDIFFEKRTDAFFSTHPDPNEKDQNLEEEQTQNQKKKEISEHKKQNDQSHKFQAQSYVVPLPQVSGAWVLLDQKEGLYPPPRYPRLAILNGWEGETIVQLDINSQGEVSNVLIIQSSGYSILDEAVIKTLRAWRFEKASPRVLEIPVKFVLKKEIGNQIKSDS